MRQAFADARVLVERALADKVFPAAVIEAGSANEVVWRQAFGSLSYDANAPRTAEDTIFDLASLTKVLATTPLVMRQVERGAVALDDTVSRYIPCWRGSDRDDITVRDLLSHASGLPAHRHFCRPVAGEDVVGASPEEQCAGPANH